MTGATQLYHDKPCVNHQPSCDIYHSLAAQWDHSKLISNINFIPWWYNDIFSKRCLHQKSYFCYSDSKYRWTKPWQANCSWIAGMEIIGLPRKSVPSKCHSCHNCCYEKWHFYRCQITDETQESVLLLE